MIPNSFKNKQLMSQTTILIDIFLNHWRVYYKTKWNVRMQLSFSHRMQLSHLKHECGFRASSLNTLRVWTLVKYYKVQQHLLNMDLCNNPENGSNSNILKYGTLCTTHNKCFKYTARLYLRKKMVRYYFLFHK